MLFVLGCLLIALTACGPEKASVDDEQLMMETRRIAQDYLANRDVSRARAELEALEVANPNQWLIFVAETDIAANSDPAAIEGLAQLASALGLHSASVARYVAANAPAAPSNAVAPSTPAVASPTVAVEQPVTLPEPTATALEQITPTVAVAQELVPTLTPSPAGPRAVAIDALNVRSGPGTAYDVVGGLQSGEAADIIGTNAQGDWWQITLVNGQAGWVLRTLVESANVEGVAVAANIPEPPPTSVPAPADTPTPEPAPVVEAATAEPAPAAASPSDTPHFTLIEKRMWSKEENGGCRGQHLLRIHVIDANGIRLNGVALQGVYLGDILVTGSQGKGDGVIEWDLHGSGEDFRVLRNDDGRDATSDVSSGHTTRSVDIPKDLLIQTGYCTNSEDCDTFYNSWGCQGHHSWEAKFQRNY